jgi:ketosteroid isomerase-like protein
MTTANTKIVTDAWAAFATRDAAKVGQCFAESAEWIAPAGNATATALDCPSHMKGRGEITRFICEAFGKLFVADVAVTFTTILADGDKVVVEERMTATLVNGRPYDLAYCFIFTVAGGVIVQVREYMDTAEGNRQVFGSGEPIRLIP